MFETVDYLWYFICVSEAAMISSGWDDNPTKAETRSQFRQRRRRAVITRRLVPLAGSAPVPLAGTSGERSREVLEEAFNNGMYHFT